MSRSVVGRASEQALLGRLITADRGLGLRIAVVTGEPGSGKSTLVEAAVEAARTAGLPVLTARPRLCEQGLAFGALADLLEGAPDLDTVGLPTAQRKALRWALALEDPEPDAEADPRVVAAGLRSVLRAATGTRRLLVVLDDAHWADRATQQVLPHAVRRLVDEPVSLLIATRPVDDDPWPEGERRDDVVLHGLTAAGLFHLVRDRLGVVLGRGDLGRLERTSGGNPMFALELAGAWATGAGRGTADTGAPLLTPTLEALLARSVRRLPPSARRLLLAAALAHDPTPDLLAEVTDLDVPSLDAAAAAAVGLASVIGGRLRFAHPLHAAAVVADAGPDERRALHQRLAELEPDLEVSARHCALAATGRDATVAARLSAAARRARARGAHPVALELAALAVRATPSGDPADLERRLELGTWALHDGDLQTCGEVVGELVRDRGGGGARPHLLLARLAVLNGSLADVEHHCSTALAAAGEDVLVRAEALVTSADGTADLAESARRARAALALLDQACAAGPDAERLRAAALAMVGHADLLGGRSEGWAELERAAAVEGRRPRRLASESAGALLAQQLLFASRLDRARQLFERLLTDARACGDEASEPLLLLNLAHLELRAGRLTRSASHSRAALALAELGGHGAARALAMAQVGEDDVRVGDVAEGQSRLQAARELAGEVGDPWLLAITWTISGRVHIARGRTDEAVTALRTAARHAARAGLVDPGWNPCPADLAETLVATGELSAADDAVGALVDGARGLERPHVTAAALRVQALLRASRAGPDDECLRLTTAAVAAHEELGTAFELGRSLLVAGRLHRRARQKRAAHDLLTRAAEVFDAVSAPLWAARTGEELSRVGLRPSAPRTLTPTEARVAELAALGRTNREIAAEVFASQKTVEAVLSRVYRKLEVRSRVELVTALAAGGPDPARH